MEIYRPLQLKSGGWHMTYSNSAGTFPTGACMDHDGHTTEDEALACWDAYRVDQQLEFHDSENPTSMQPCVECHTWTGGYGILRGEFPERRFLCDGHRNKAVYAKHLRRK